MLTTSLYAYFEEKIKLKKMEMTAAVAHEFFMCHAFKKSQKEKKLKGVQRKSKRNDLCLLNLV